MFQKANTRGFKGEKAVSLRRIAADKTILLAYSQYLLEASRQHLIYIICARA
jgi:hypothetical protein